MEPTRIWNPPNPYLTEHRELLGEPPVAEVELYEDHSQSILSENDSPDIGFRWSVNPYRGCFHACAYCLHGDTPIFMADGTTKRLQDLRIGDSVYGTVVRGDSRRYVRTRVLAHWSTVKPAYRVLLEDGTELIASADHQFLTNRGWKYVTGSEQGRARRPHLTCNVQLMGTGRFMASSPAEAEYRRGYLSGMIRGDGLLGTYRYDGRRRVKDVQYHFRLALTDFEALWRARRYLSDFGVATDEFVFGQSVANRKPMRAIRTQARANVERVRELAISRKRDIEGQALKSDAPLQVIEIQPLGLELPMFDIMTDTGDFIANGVVSHNCYARPTHEYFGFGAGTDFERRIFVKPRAPQLLEAAFDTPSWRGERIAFSGVTDCYQPLEAAWKLTRRCLEVCLKFRNPAAIITKSLLIRRDAELLAALAREAEASVSISIPFLDERIARLIEPGAPTIKRRFETMRILADAGVPVGIGVAPIIPGLNDSDIPGLLKEAKRCGARDAFKTLLRLPGSVKAVFFHRLQEALPDRAAKIEHRIREVRGGALSDSRFGHRHHGEGAYWDLIDRQWELWTRRLGFK